MRWKRGLFRLWIVVAVLWVIGAVWIGWNGVFNPYISGRVVVLDPATETFEITDASVYSGTHYPRSGNDHMIIEIIDTDYAFEFPEGSDITFQKIVETKWLNDVVTSVGEDRKDRRNQKRLSAIRTVLLVSLLPPAIVLAIGAAFAWAFSGFSRKDEVTETVASRLESDLSEQTDNLGN